MKKQQDGNTILLFLYHSAEEASTGAASAGSSSGSVRYSGIYSGRRERRSAFLNKKNQGVTIRTEKLPVNLISAGSFLCPHFVKIPPTGKHFSAHR